MDASLEDILEKVLGGVFLFEGAYMRHPFDFSPEDQGNIWTVSCDFGVSKVVITFAVELLQKEVFLLF